MGNVEEKQYQFIVRKVFSDGAALLKRTNLKSVANGGSISGVEGSVSQLVTSDGKVFDLDAMDMAGALEQDLLSVPTAETWIRSKKKIPSDYFKVPVKSISIGEKAYANKAPKHLGFLSLRKADETVAGHRCEVYETKFFTTTETTWFDRAAGMVVKVHRVQPDILLDITQTLIPD